MKYQMTVVLEYNSVDEAPRISVHTKGKDLGEGEVVAVQFSNALAELAVLEEQAAPELRQAAHEEGMRVAGRPVRGEGASRDV